MKKIHTAYITAIAGLLAILTARAIAEPVYLIEQGYNESGAYVERLVEIPAGATADSFQSTLTEQPPQAVRRDVDPPIAIVQHGGNLFLTFGVSFGEFAELRPNWTRREADWLDAATAELNGQPGPAPDAQPDSAWSGAFEWVRENPGKATSAAIAGLLLLDYWDDGSLNLFGARGRSGGNSSPPEPTNSNTASETSGLVIQGDNNTVNFNEAPAED